MEQCTLNHDTWLKFTNDALSVDEREQLIAHLDPDCEDCDRFFSELEPEDIRAGMQSAAGKLSEALEDRFEPGPDGRDEIFARVMAQTRKRSFIPSIITDWKPAFASVAVMMLMFIVAHQVWGPFSLDGIKGGRKAPPSIVLRVAVLKDIGNAPVRAIPGGGYDQDDILFFRYEIETLSYVYLIRTDGVISELLHPDGNIAPVAEDVGVYGFREGDSASGFYLNGLEGRQIFVAIASRRPMDFHMEIEPLLQRIINKEIVNWSDEWTLDSFEIDVIK